MTRYFCDYCGVLNSAAFPSPQALDDHVATAHMPPSRKDDE